MKIRRLFSLMPGLAAMVSLPLFATTGAILTPTAGTVAINGQPASAGSAVIAGDRITTSAAGSARMLLPGGSLLAASNTVFDLESVNGAARIRLHRGLVEVEGLLPVALNLRTVEPASVHTRFTVYDAAGKVYVEAVAGKVTLTSGSRHVVVPAGKTVEFSDAAAAAGLSPVATRTLLLGALGASAVGLVLAIQANHTANSVSPSM